MNGHTIVRISVTGLLTIASALKIHELLVGNSLDAHQHRWLSIGLIQSELILAIWLISRWMPRISWATTGGVFVCFTIYSLFRVLNGHESCGCFGELKIDPRGTMLLDIGVVTCLWRYRSPCRGSEQAPSLWSLPNRISLPALGLTFVLGAILTQIESTTLATSGELAGDTQFVLLEPETWLDKPFALASHILHGDELRDGEWIVLLYHHDCPKCQDVLPQYQLLADSSSQRVAFVEVPPYGHRSLRGADDKTLWTELADNHEWFVSAPVELVVTEGIVRSVTNDIEATRFAVSHAEI